jgi:hypothetical protein
MLNLWIVFLFAIGQWGGDTWPASPMDVADRGGPIQKVHLLSLMPFNVIVDDLAPSRRILCLSKEDFGFCIISREELASR